MARQLMTIMRIVSIIATVLLAVGSSGPALADLDAAGWTILSPSPDTQTLYVSSSEGDDANDGTDPLRPLKTIAAGKSKLRDGYPDWLLLKRGDSWDKSFGTVEVSGRSPLEPIVLGAYGEGDRPRIRSSTWHGINHVKPDGKFTHIRVVGLHFEPDRPDPGVEYYGIELISVEDVLIEDCAFIGYVTNVRLGASVNVTLRRCVVADSYSIKQHSQGIFADWMDGLVIEENVFDHNGWNQDVSGAHPTMFNHNIYIQHNSSGVVIRKNILSRAASHGVQARSGGVVEGNLVVRNALGILFGGRSFSQDQPIGSTGRVSGNVVMEAKDIDPSMPRRCSIEVADASDEGIVVENNIVGPVMAGLSGSNVGYGYLISLAQGVGVRNLVFRGNVADSVLPLAISGSSDRDNLVGGPYAGDIRVEGNYLAARYENVTVVSTWNDSYSKMYSSAVFRGNAYRSSAAEPHKVNEAGSVVYYDTPKWAEFSGDDSQYAADARFIDATRSVTSYHEMLGGSGGFEGFIDTVRKQRKENWNVAYTAAAVNTYIREGFTPTDWIPTLTVQSPPAPPSATEPPSAEESPEPTPPTASESSQPGSETTEPGAGDPPQDPSPTEPVETAQVELLSSSRDPAPEIPGAKASAGSSVASVASVSVSSEAANVPSTSSTTSTTDSETLPSDPPASDSQASDEPVVLALSSPTPEASNVIASELLEPYDELLHEPDRSLVRPGSGFASIAAPLAPVGGPGPGADAVTMAHWDTVPYQRVADEAHVGVVAFHINGIDRVEFSVEGGAPLSVNEMTPNPTTGIAEYWATIDLSGVPDGPIEVRATVFPTRGVPRVLEPLWMIVDHGGSPSVERWVATTGSDDAGNGSQQNPFRTFTRAARSIASANTASGPAGGGVIYALPGDYDLGGAKPDGVNLDTPGAWLTITPAAGANPSAVRITSSSKKTPIGASRVRLQGLTVFQTALMNGKDRSGALWLDGCELRGNGTRKGMAGTTRKYWEEGVYVTDCLVEDVRIGLQNVSLARSVELSNISMLAFDHVDAVIDATVDGMPYGKGAVLYYNSKRIDNAIVYGLTTENVGVPGLIAKGLSDVAMANVMLDTGGSSASSVRGELSNLVLWHVSVPNEPINLRTKPTSVINLSIRNCVFLEIRGCERLPATTEFADGMIVPGVDNNHFVTGPFIGTNSSRGAKSDVVSLSGRMNAVLLPYDIHGNPTALGGAIGAEQPENDLAPRTDTYSNSTDPNPIGLPALGD